MKPDETPKPFTEQEEFVACHRVCAIKTSYEMTGADTAQDYITLTDLSGKTVTWKMESFTAIARLAGYVSATSSLVEPKEYGLRERIQKRKAWEEKNARELAEYKRLKEKFGS